MRDAEADAKLADLISHAGDGAIIIDCDHGVGTDRPRHAISSRRSRLVMVAQLRAAQKLLAALQDLGKPQGAIIHLHPDRHGGRSLPTIELDLAAFMGVWTAVQTYASLAPTEDDLRLAPVVASPAAAVVVTETVVAADDSPQVSPESAAGPAGS